VRDRLLAKAASARPEFGADQERSSGPDELLGSLTEELDRVAARPQPPAAPASSLPGSRRNLSPNIIALFGTLLGLALLSALFAILIHLDPRDGTALGSGTLAVETAVPGPTASAPLPPSPPSPLVVKKPERQRIPGPFRIDDSTDPKLKKVSGTIAHASFLKALEDSGVPKAQTFRILKVMKELRDLDHCGKSDQFRALIERASSRVVAFEYVVTKEEIYQAREGADGYLKAEKLDLHVERSRVQGAIRYDQPTFVASVEAGGFEPGLASVIDEALLGHASVADFRKGDRLRVVAQEVTVLGEFEHYAGIEALEVAPARGDERPLRIYYFRGTSSHGYYDAGGRAVHEGGWRKPVKGARITSHFNPHRMHPILHKLMPHQGTDFGVAMGTPVGASGPGVVKFIGNGGPSGNLVTLEHAGGLETGYAHLSRFESGLKVGDHVTALQIVGYVGSTGRSTGPHLHFSLKKNGVFIDAETLKFDALRVLPDAERAVFIETRTRLDGLLDAIAMPPPLEEDKAPTGPSNAVPPAQASSLARVNPPSLVEGPASAAAPPGKSPTIYLSDQDLMKNQSATDDGEVDE
jgi:murein DD-endopeptidase MepM/ murein hydrolase activator NlpD